MAKTWQSMLAVLAVAGTVLFGGAPAALAQTGGGGGGPDPTAASTAERVSAEVLPAVTYLQIDIRSYMRDMITGRSYAAPNLTFTCTGFAVSPNGLIATAGHCVDDQEVLAEVADIWARDDAAKGYDYQAQFNDYMINFRLEGAVGSTPPDRTITAFRATSTANQADAGMPAQVVDKKGFDQGDVALLKVDATNLPTVEVVPSDAVNTGTAIMSVGYPRGRDAVVDRSLAPTWKDGSVSSRQYSKGIPFLELTSGMGRGMSGGPTVNQQGQVVGVNSRGTDDGTDTSNFVAPSSALLDMMARNGVRSEAGPVDIAYRSGLDEYFSGRYSDAAEQFQRVLDLQPTNKMASEYRVKALSAHNQFGDKGSIGLVGWLLVGGGAFLVLVTGGVTLLLVRRSRRRRAGPGTEGAPHPTQPFVGPLGHGVDVPAPRNGDDPVRPFGATPFGDEAAPQSPPIGFPMPAAGTNGATATLADGPGTGSPTATLPSARDDDRAAGAPSATATAGFCPHCGTARTPGARFCGNCGLQA